MRKILSTIILTVIILSCVNQGLKQESRSFDEFYSVLDNLIRFNLQDVSAISYETMPVYCTMWGTDSIPNDSISPPPPPPPLINYVDIRHLKYVLKRNNMDSLEAYSMYRSIDSTKTIKIDQNRISIPVITKDQFSEFFNSGNHEGFEKIKKAYGTSCYIRVSTPIYNADYTKMILFIDYLCGPLWGQGYQFILVKKDGKWRVIDEGGTWES